MTTSPRPPLRRARVLALVLLSSAGCHGGKDAAPGEGHRTTSARSTFSTGDAARGLNLAAGTPTRISHVIALPPGIQVDSATVDLEATLAQVQVTPAALPVAGARAPRAAAATAQMTVRVGPASAADTVCDAGRSYGPFTIALGPTSQPAGVTPATATASTETLSVVNGGQFATCVEIVYPVAATLDVNAVVVEHTRAACGEAPASFAGTWTGTYSCTYTCGEGFSGPVTIDVTESGEDAAYVDDGGSRFSGTVCGSALRFARNTPAENETGTLTLNPDGTATKRSTYRANTPPFCAGDCTDALHRVTDAIDSCDTRTLNGECKELTGLTASQIATYRSGCLGTWSAAACPGAGRVGVCTYATTPQGVPYRWVVYSPAWTAPAAQSYCLSTGGSWAGS